VGVAAVGVATVGTSSGSDPAGIGPPGGATGAPPGRRSLAGPAGKVFPWASVTKPVTALAVLVAVEEGTLGLGTAAGPPGSTVAHLLAHASGLGPEGDRPLAAPGSRRIYSNAGFEVLGRVLAEHSGIPFERYVAEAVLEPLGMSGSSFGPGADPAAGRVGARPAATPAVPTGAASGLWGTAPDLLALAVEWSTPTLVSPATHAQASAVVFPGLGGVLPGIGRFEPCDWGLGVEVKGAKHPHWSGDHTSPATFGHFGRSGSFLWIDPAAGVACVGLADRPFGPWALEAWSRLADAVLTEVAGGG